jgi:RNA recognition motif. (a.k.a. RRM, RBD, or RNP domain)
MPFLVLTNMMTNIIPLISLIGNLDERVSEKVLYEIMIQAGRLVDLHIPRDKETNKHKGYAFAEYESPEIADYAIRLFNGLVRLHNRTVKFAVCSYFLIISLFFALSITVPMFYLVNNIHYILYLQ